MTARHVASLGALLTTAYLCLATSPVPEDPRGPPAELEIHFSADQTEAFVRVRLTGTEVATSPSPRNWPATKLHAFIATLVTAAIFSAVKLTHAGHAAYLTLLGRVYPWFDGTFLELAPPANVPDPTDLIALAALAYPLWLAHQRARRFARATRGKLCVLARKVT
jgi:hypothetical protein